MGFETPKPRLDGIEFSTETNPDTGAVTFLASLTRIGVEIVTPAGWSMCAEGKEQHMATLSFKEAEEIIAEKLLADLSEFYKGRFNVIVT